MLRQQADKAGYLYVNVYEPRKWRRPAVHKLVCEVFHGPRPEWADLVAHVDGNPANNRADNLRWATYAENEADKRHHGRALLGERHHQARLTAEQVIAMRAERARGDSLSTLVGRYGVGMSQVQRIVNGKSWRHL